jgi:catalase-peroxidase
MAMNDEETVALIAGGHSFGKTHGAGDPDLVGPEPEAAPLEEQGLGWKSAYGSGKAGDTITSGLEVTWTPTPTKWGAGTGFFDMLFNYEYELSKSPAGAHQWVAKDAEAIIPDAHGGPNRKPTMLTTDLSLKLDPVYGPISKRFHENPDEFRLAFAKAWYKLLHRDMGPVSRYLGPWVAEPQIWQDPVPDVDHPLVSDADVAALKEKVLGSGLAVTQLVSTAWASAATFRTTDKRGGANGARIRLEPQKAWAVNEGTGEVIAKLEEIQQEFNANGETKISLADLIVLGGVAAVEKAAQDGGVDVAVRFRPGRTDASQEQTDADSFAVLEPRADGFRNFLRGGEKLPPEKLLLERAYMLGLSAPEMTVLVAGLRSLGVSQGGHGVFTDRPGVLTNEVLVSLLAPGAEWKASEEDPNVYRASDGRTATAVDLVFGANSQLRALAEVYASDDAQEKFVRDFAEAFAKVTELDRFDLA